MDRTIFKRVEKNANMWVDKEDLQRIQTNSKDMEQYAINLMWDVLIPTAELIRILEFKVQKGGFVKMLGTERINSAYRKSPTDDTTDQRRIEISGKGTAL